MGKLFFKYGTVNSLKSMDLLRTVHNYEEKNFKVVVIKNIQAGNNENTIYMGIDGSKSIDYLINDNDVISDILDGIEVSVIVVDEAQFLTKKQVEDLFFLAKEKDITVYCYGLKTDFKTRGFTGSIRLFELADKIEEITTLCSCGSKAMFNIRKQNNQPVFDGNQIAIDGFCDITYEQVCGLCYIKKFNESKKAGFTVSENIFE